ncbi:MAG: hypothetical protein HDR09_16940 [Lachnospiraceae bacterium]|nr:hypothetical protein [Lachnospiraceae bacterium]
MKQNFTRIVSIILSISIIFVSVLLCPVSVYATGHGGGGNADHGKLTAEEKRQRLQEILDNSEKYLLFLVSEMSAHVNGAGFYEFYSNFVEYEKSMGVDYFLEENITVEDDGSITYSQDLVASIKQALQEYADETNPFTIRQTYRARDIPASTFPSKKIYNTFLAYATSHAVTAFSTYTNSTYKNGTLKMGDVTPLIKDGGGFVYATKNTCNTVNGDWNYEQIIYDEYNFGLSGNEIIITTTRENVGYFEKLFVYVPTTTDFQIQYGSNAYLVTPDGGRIRVFNSLTEFMDYNAGQRKVYFGSGFYDFDPTDITATWDEINDKIGRMDDILQDILDAINKNPNLSEEDLEKLIDELIGKIGEIGGEIGGSIDETNSLLGGIASSLSGYFESVLSALSELAGMIEEGFMILSEQLDTMIFELGLIYESMGDMTEEEVSEKTDSLLSQLFSAFSEIGDVLKGKFPFCLPNDLYTMLALLAGNEVSVSPGAGGGGGGDGNGDIMICAYGAGDEESKAPVFEIPFVIGSADIEEKIIIDLSPFEYISKLSRTLMTLYYCACLMQLTLKVIDLGKDLGDD